MAEWQSITLVRYSEKLEPRNTPKLRIVFNPALAGLNIQSALPAATPRLLTLRRVCHSYSAGLPSQRPIKLKFRDRLCIRMRTRTRMSHQPIVSCFRCQVCRLVKLQFADCLTASGAISCCAFASTGGERAGAIAGAVVGAPACYSICITVAGSDEHVMDSLAGRADPDAIRTAADFSDLRASYTGLARYWKKKLGA